MAEGFDPDAFLAGAGAPAGFDPDAFLKSTEQAPSMAGDIGRSAVSGLEKGVAGLPGIPGNLISMGKTAGDWINRKLYSPEQIAHFEANRERFAKTPPTSSETIGAAESATGQKFYEPQTVPGQFAQTIGEFAPNAIGGPGSIAGRVASRVVAPAVASETAGQVTKGTAAEPYARVGAALLTQGPQGVRDIRNTVKKPDINAPSLEELHDAAAQAYRNARGYGVEIKRQPVSRLADDIMSDLHNDGFRKLDAPSSWAKLEELKNPSGRYVTIDDIESVRRALGKANPMNGMEKEVGRRGIEAIDKYVSSLDRNAGHIAVNQHYAADVASDIKEARGNWAAMKRGETIEGKLDEANRGTAATGSGANINNKTRQQINQVLRSPKLRRGFSAEEIGAMRQIVTGTTFGNAARKVGKLSPEGVVSGTLGIELGHVASGNLAHGLLVPALGKVAKIFGDRSTAKQAERLSQMVRARSPLGGTLPQPAPPPSFSQRPYVQTGLLGQSSAQEQGHAAGGRTEGGETDDGLSISEEDAAADSVIDEKEKRARGGRVPGELTESNKHSHQEVGYVSVSPRKKQRCEICWKFIPASEGGPSCLKIQSPIAAAGWCRRFSRTKP